MTGRGVTRTWIAITATLFALVGALFAPVASGASDASSDADGGAIEGGAPADSPDADAGAAIDLELLRSQLADVRLLVAGKLPERFTIAELFTIDVLDDDAVAKRSRELEVRLRTPAGDAGGSDTEAEADVDARAEDARDAGDADALDAGALDASETRTSPPILQRDLDEARLAFLSQPRAERARVVDAEVARAKRRAEAVAAAAEKDKALEAERAAEAARKKAVEAAAQEEDARKRAIANELARAEEIHVEQATDRRELAERRAADLAHARERSATIAAFVQRAGSATLGTTTTDALYDDVVKALDVANLELGAALDRHAARVDTPRFTPDAQILSSDDPALAEDIAEVRALAKALDAEASALDADTRKLDDRVLDDTLDDEQRLNTARLSLIARLSADKRDRILGLGAEGLKAFRRELTHLRLLARWAAVSGVAAARKMFVSLKDPFVLTSVLTKLALLAALMAAMVTLRRRGPGWTERARPLLATSLRGSIFGRPAQRVLAIMHALFRELVAFVALLVAPMVLGFTTTGTVLGAAYGALLGFATYRLLLVAAHRGIAYAAASPAAPLSPVASAKLLRSLRLAGIYTLVTYVTLVLSVATLGRGFLYHLVLRFAWLGAIPIALVLVRAWRGDIVDAYLKRRPTGVIADAVARTRERWYGFFLALVAVVFVFAAWLGRTARTFVLGFERSRRALAYLFRRRLEKQAQTGEAPDPDKLPEDFRAFFVEAPAKDDSFTLDRHPDLDLFQTTLDEWRNGGASGAVLVLGRTGFGKSSWCVAAMKRLGELPTTHLLLEARIRTPEALVTALRKAIFSAVEDDLAVARLAADLRDGPRRAIVLDDVQNLFLRGVETTAAWATLAELVRGSGKQVLWIAAAAHYPWEWMEFVRRGTDPFRLVVRVPPWSEQEIAKLLRTRMEASGYEAIYDDLVVERLEGDEGGAQLVSTGEEYVRLLWDYAEGSPRVALHAWLHSLVPDEGKRLRVRLFQRPDATFLEAISERKKFLLAAVVWHESLTAPEAADSLRYPHDLCADDLANLRERGVLRERDGRYRVATPWWPVVLRYLRRKHLIET